MTEEQKKLKDISSENEDKSPFPKEILEITGEELLAFFEQLEPEPSCPVCKHDMKVMAAVDFDEEGNPKGYLKRPALVGAPIHEDPAHKIEFKTPCFSISCSNCGHLCYFMVNPVLRWKKKHGQKG